MKSLSSTERKRMLGDAGYLCAICHNHMRRNFCRRCGEFFEEGHSRECPVGNRLNHDHRGHEVYLKENEA